MHETPHVEGAGDVNPRGVAWGFAMILGGIVLACAGAWLAYRMLRPPQGFAGPATTAGMRVAGPRLDPAPQPAKAAYEAEKERLVNGYGWVDRKAGVARIPVEQAMELMARQAQAGQGRARP
jgi:hypothetical protein